jgi:4-amino-4-deoxy-L-arabinose transferase-like glycosyltransferase
MKKIVILLLVFVFALSLRLWNLNKMGRTWDESAYVEVGYQFVQLIEKGDIGNKFFYQWTDEPPLARYVYGIFGSFDTKTVQGKTVFNYDYTYARLASATMSSIAVVIVALIGWEFISYSVGVFSAIIFAMLPFFLGLSQTATLESPLVLTFTAAVYSFLRFIKKTTYKNAILVGLFLGLAVLTKFTNVLLVPLFIAIYIAWKLSNPKGKTKSLIKKIAIIFFVSLATFFAFWPMILFKPFETIVSVYHLRASLGMYPDIEVFFGRLMHLPVFYFFVMFLITTPLLILVLFFVGSKRISDYCIKTDVIKRAKLTGFKSEKWFLYSLLIWFCLPFIQSFYNFRHHGVRFIIEIYAPLSIIAAIGFDHLASRFTQKTIMKFVLFIPILLYLFVTLAKITPYYLDYYNGVVGGTKTVYEEGMFELGWWGQGMKEVGNYLQKNAKPQSRIGLFISPLKNFPPLKNQQLIFIDPNKGVYNPKIKYDYVVVNYYHVLREGFDDSQIKVDYKLVDEVKADGGVLISIYAKK